ncbi:zinc finger protein 771-like [Epinephelus fuscoguttatus]|uniref:zinc finger protein 771-like n=1 Tax=Epinephelus fuscoguttatus TaxID=293821 RepID=UPI0020D12894|nr:zinc finger protein 771-like [Epinephelus fuscoguttatus]
MSKQTDGQRQQLDAVTEEIFRLVDRTLTDYEEVVSRLKENEERHKLLDAVSNTKVQSVFPADAPPEVSPSLDQEDPEHPHIKEKQQDFWTSLAGDQPRGLEEADITKSEDDQESQTGESTEAAAGSSAQQMETEAASSSDSHRPSSSITGQKPWRCSVCEIRFSYKSLLQRHVRVRKGWKPFGCSVCEKRFLCKKRKTTWL